MYIVDLLPTNQNIIHQTATILVQAFKDNWPNAWPTLTEALAEVHESFAPERISRVALNDNNQVLGWVGAIPEYNGNAWEVHPLAVSPTYQGQGIGKALMLDLEQLARQQNVCTLFLGTDDENNMTSLSGVNLYPNVWEHITTIKNLHRHPYEFYQKLGFSIVGVLPDANGWGKPDIYMAKSLRV